MLQCFAVHSHLDDPRCDQAIGAEASDEVLRPSCSERSLHHQPLAALRPTLFAGQFGFDEDFINKDNAPWLACDGWKVVPEPLVTQLSCPCAVPLSGDQYF